MWKRAIWIMGSLASCFPIVAAAVTIDTTGDQFSFFGFGEQDPNSPFVYHETFGQTITVPESETVLDRFAFFLSGPGGGTFAAYVMKWTGTQATGQVLYESAPRQGPSAGYVPVAFETGGLSLIGGGSYVVFLSGSKFMNGSPDVASYRLASDKYAGGQWVFLNNGADFSAVTTSPWSPSSTRDTSFTATFSVPEPGAVWLSAAGLGLLGTSRFRKRLGPLE